MKQIRATQEMENVSSLIKDAKEMAINGNVIGSIGRFEAILIIDPSSFEANFNLGVLYTQQSEIEKSIAKYEKCLQIKFNDRNSVINLAYLLKSVYKSFEAINIIDQFLNQYPDDIQMSNLRDSFSRDLILEMVERENSKCALNQDASQQQNKSLVFEYPTSSDNSPRWGWGKETHPKLTEIISREKDVYRSLLERFDACKETFIKIPAEVNHQDRLEPHLNNSWLNGLDALALYGMFKAYKPKLYIEVGSGFSTKFAKKAVTDFNLESKIISIDPAPRVEINTLCDYVIRKPLENVDLQIFDLLEANDILFIDNSHRCFMNSDVTVTFLDIIPRLKPGVIVQVHDILLPNDYLKRWDKRYYSEQYLLAAYLLAEGEKIKILLPNAYLTCNVYPEFSCLIEPFFANKSKENVSRMGVSFWFQIADAISKKP